MRLRVLLLAVALLVIAAPASAQETTVTYSGRVTAGQFLELTCPEGTMVQITQGNTVVSASASFYRNERRTAVVALNQPPSGGGSVTQGWNVPKGTRYADATLTCEPPPRELRFTGHATAGQEVTVVCPSDVPHAWTAGPVIFESDQGQSTVLPQERVYDESGQWIGITFTAPEAGSWWVDLSCQWRPYE